MTFSEIPFSKSEKSLEYKDFQSSATPAWEATIIADIRTLRSVGIIAKGHGKFNPFLSMGFSVEAAGDL